MQILFVIQCPTNKAVSIFVWRKHKNLHKVSDSLLVNLNIQRYNMDVYFGIFEVFLCPTWNVVLNNGPRRRRILSMTLFTRK